MTDKNDQKLWGGRFSGAADPEFAEFIRPFAFDRELFEPAVRASIAHCDGLLSAGILINTEVHHIKSALATILVHAHSNEDYFDELSSEDAHSFVEARLVELIDDT